MICKVKGYVKDMHGEELRIRIKSVGGAAESSKRWCNRGCTNSIDPLKRPR